MKGFVRSAAVLSLLACLVFAGTAVLAADICPMGGVKISVPVDMEKAAEWLEDERREFISDDEGPAIIALSDKTDKIAVVLTADYVFFGVADDRDDREASESRMTKAFGNELRLLRAAVQDEVKELYRAQVIDIDGGDVSKIAEAVGLGTVSGGRGDWSLETEDCEAMTVNVDEID